MAGFGASPMYRYLILLEKANDNYSAYSPDLPGRVATGDTRQQTEANMREAVQFHLEGLKADNLPIPAPSATAQYVEVE